MSLDQHIQNGYTVLCGNTVLVAIALRQIAGNRHVLVGIEVLQIAIIEPGGNGHADGSGLRHRHPCQGHKGIGALGSQADRLPGPIGGNGDGALAVGAGGIQGGIQSTVLGIH